MASSKWKSTDELRELVRDRTVVFWGASNWVERTLETLSVGRAYVVDNNPNNHGIEYCGFPVYPPARLADEPDGSVYVIVCTVNYASVIDELHAMGFAMGDEFACAPLLNERRAKDELVGLERHVLVASPQHAFGETTGGGIYEVDTRTGDYTKRYTGKCRGMSYRGEDLLVIDMLRGLVVLDRNFEERAVFELEKNSEPHGVFCHEPSGLAYVGQPGRDSVAVYSVDDQKCIRELFISDKWERNRKDNHHVNDCLVHENSLFVSMFSFTGNWMNEMYDGGVLEMDLESGEIRGPVVTGAWMPHSITRFGGKLCWVDSMRGELRDSNHSCLGRFPAFIRGLDHDGRYYFIGATQHRYPEKLKGDSLNISLDTGVYVFDPETKMSRFLQCREAETIHSIILKRS